MNRKDRLELVYKAALKVFSKYGYRKSTVEDIANELGMTKGNLYTYVDDKRDLYEKAVAYGLRRWQKAAADAMEAEEDPLNGLITFAMTGWSYLAQDAEMQNIVVNDPSVFPLYPEEDRFYKINLDSMNMVKKLLRTGIAQKRFREMDVDSVVPFLYSIYIMFVIKTYVKSKDNTVADMVGAATEVVLNGILEK